MVREDPISVSQFQPDFEVKNGVAKIAIPESVIADVVPLWKSFVVGHFMGDVPHVGTIHATVNRIWTILDKASKIDVQIINKTTVLFRIANSRIRERVLKRKYWHIGDIPLVVSEWNPEASQAPPDLSAMPMWIDLQDVPGYLFSQKGLELLSSTVGHFVKLHPNTERCVRLDVARVLVEVNLQKELTQKISFTNEKREEILVSVNYPWLPPKCKICSRWGHRKKDCSAGEKVKLASRNTTSTKEAPMGATVISETVQELAQKLIQDLQKSPAIQANSTEPIGAVDATVMDVDDKSSELQWTTVARNKHSSPIRTTSVVTPSQQLVSPNGFHVLQVEGGGESEVSTVQIEEKRESAELADNSTAPVMEKEEGEVVESDSEAAGEDEKQGRESPIAEGPHMIEESTVTNTHRHRSRSRGPPKPITQRKVSIAKGNKQTSSRKL